MLNDINLIAVNARNLQNLYIDVEKACMALDEIPDTYLKLGFSGITSANEVLQYKKAGAKGVLIGTSLTKSKNIKEFLSSIGIPSPLRRRLG